MGLSICQSLATRMGGHVWVESVVDQGSSFFFTVRLGLPSELLSEAAPESEVWLL